jgi:hypothetical protein
VYDVGVGALDLLKDLLIGCVFYLLGKRSADRQQEELKQYIREMAAYDAGMLRTLEEQGALSIPRDAAGNPVDVQVIRPEGIASAEGVGTPTISLGPPPKPPQRIDLDHTATARGIATHDYKIIPRTPPSDAPDLHQ